MRSNLQLHQYKKSTKFFALFLIIFFLPIFVDLEKTAV